MTGRVGWRLIRRATMLGGLAGLPVAIAPGAPPPLSPAASPAPLATPAGTPASAAVPVETPPTEFRPPVARPPIPRSAAELPSLEADAPGALA